MTSEVHNLESAREAMRNPQPLPFEQAQSVLMPIMDMGRTQSMYILTLCEWLDGDITINASRIGAGVVTIHRYGIDTFIISSDELTE